jgi:uncharacterized membrane protein YcaP (DUF421 family)
VQNAIIGNDNSVTGGIIGASALLLTNYVVIRVLYRHKNLEKLVEGMGEVLIENGKIKQERLSKEFITLEELEAAAHRQGFASLHEIDRAVLEPGGILTCVGKKPAPEEQRHVELVERLDKMMKELAQLRQLQAPPSA